MEALIQQINELLDDPEKFRQWLDEQPGGYSVGTAQESCSCPIARYLGDRLQQSSLTIEVGDVEIRVQDDRAVKVTRLPITDWAHEFVESIDSQYDMEDDVFPEDAIAILNEIKDMK